MQPLDEKRSAVEPWVPAVLCAFLSLPALFGSTVSTAGGQWWQPAFFAFLPICFFFVGAANANQRRQVRELRRQLDELRGEIRPG